MSGKGRGRGWLKLDKLEETKPGRISPVALEIKVNDEWKEKYHRIENEIRKFSGNDDGIQLNKKYKIIVKILIDELTTSESVRNLAKYLFSRALHDETFITPFIMLLTLQTLTDLCICEEHPKKLIISCMQEKFETHNPKVLKEDKAMFHNAVKILCEFYHRGKYFFLEAELHKNFKLLLDSGEADNVDFFTNMYLKTCSHLVDVSLFLKVRDVMISQNNLLESTKLKLMLIIDMSNTDNVSLSPELVNYYRNKLGDTIIHLTQNQHSLSSKKTNLMEFNYGSVLNQKKEVLPDETSLTNNVASSKPYKSPSFEDNCYFDGKLNRPVHTDGLLKEVPYLPPTVQQNNYHQQQTGRPILGAGARDKNKSNNDAGMNLNRPMSKTNHRPKNKGWEHDDRFDTDYS